VGAEASGVTKSISTCRDNRSVLYVRAPKLFDDLALTHGDGSLARRLKSLAAVQLLILDDWGLEPLSAEARHDLLEVLEERYARRSTLVTSQLPDADWHGLIGHATYADAILDRLVHNPHRVDLAGESMRRPQTRQQLTNHSQQRQINHVEKRPPPWRDQSGIPGGMMPFGYAALRQWLRATPPGDCKRRRQTGQYLNADRGSNLDAG
jgi:IstB-like ATP binding protein